MKEYTQYLLRMASERENALKPLQLVITPKLQLIKIFNLNQLLLFSLPDVIVILLTCHFTDATQ